MKRQRVVNLLLSIGVLIAIGCSLIFVNKPVEIDAITYIGAIATLIGCAITILVGYQIINTIEINRKVNDLEKKSQELEIEIIKTKESREAMSSTMMTLNRAFDELTDFLIFLCDLKTLRWQLKFKNHCDIPLFEVDKFEKDAFNQYFVEDIDDSIRIFNRNDKSLTIVAAAEKYIDIVKSVDVIIRKDDNFHKIQASYERMMNSFYNRMKELFGVE